MDISYSKGDISVSKVESNKVNTILLVKILAVKRGNEAIFIITGVFLIIKIIG